MEKSDAREFLVRAEGVLKWMGKHYEELDANAWESAARLLDDLIGMAMQVWRLAEE